MKTITTLGIVSILAMSFVSISYASIDKNLKYGQKDKEVTELQEFLIDKGLLKTTPSTYFGLLTLKAVKAYQTSIGVSPTGFVGVLTREKINKEITLGATNLNETKNTVVINSNAQEATTNASTITSTKFISGCTSGTGFSSITGKPCAIEDVKPKEAESIYDNNTMLDKLGREITIIQNPNYKFNKSVLATVNVLGTTVRGIFDKNTKTFMTENEIDFISKQNQAEDDKKMGINQQAVIIPTPSLETPSVYVTPMVVPRLSGPIDNFTPIFSYELKNITDKPFEINSVTYKIGSKIYFEQSLPIKFTKPGTAIQEVTSFNRNSNALATYKFTKPLILFPRENFNLLVWCTICENINSMTLDSFDVSPSIKIHGLPMVNEVNK